MLWSSLHLKVYNWLLIISWFNLIIYRFFIIFVSDFCCNSDNSISLSTPDCTIQDDNNQNASDTEFERNNDDSLEEEIPDLNTSLESSQQNLSFSQNTSTNGTLNDTSNEIYSNTPSNTSSLITHINSTVLSNDNDLDNYLNNIRENIDVSSVLDSPPESINSKDRRYFWYFSYTCNILL